MIVRKFGEKITEGKVFQLHTNLLFSVSPTPKGEIDFLKNKTATRLLNKEFAQKSLKFVCNLERMILWTQNSYNTKGGTVCNPVLLSGTPEAVIPSSLGPKTFCSLVEKDS